MLETNSEYQALSYSISTAPCCAGQPFAFGHSMSFNLKSSAVFIALVGSAFLCHVAYAEDNDSPAGLKATPYRPTVSNPADLPVPRHLEWEAGGLFTDDREHIRRNSIPFLLKYALNEDFGILVGGDSFVSDHANGSTDTGWGDTNLVAKYHYAISNSTALGVEAGAKLPTAASDLGSGHTDFTLNGIVSTQVNDFDIDVNASYTRLGRSDEGASRGVFGWAVAAARDIARQWTLSGELSGTHQGGVPSATQFLGALSYTAQPNVVLDGGGLAGLNRGAPRYGLFAGLTVLIR